MYSILCSLVAFLTLSFSVSAIAFSSEDAELQGHGAFSRLHKEWMLMALYSVKATDATQLANPQRLEIKIASDKLSTRRFRSLWLDTLLVEHGGSKVAAMEAELKQFFDVIQGPLQKGDTLIFERTGQQTEVKVNYYTLATLSAEFLPTIVQSLVGKHPPTQALKTGLNGQDSLRNQVALSNRFERLEPSLPRIAEVSRWGKRILASN